jgi:unsaturated rhamnogalacturonyl hydrolase
MVRGWMAHSPDPWYPDHVGPGRVLLELWRATGDRSFLAYAKGLGNHLAGLPHNQQGLRFHRPDLPDRARSGWVDSMQTDAPFLCLLGSATGEERWFNLGAEFILGHVDALWDRDSWLFRHSYNDETKRVSGALWGRGNGWAMLGLVYCLESLPASHPRYPTILRCAERFARAVVEVQDGGTGLWHTILDDPGTRCEASGSLMLSCGLMRGSRSGTLPPVYGDAGAKAWRTLRDAVEPDGTVRDVSARSAPRNDAQGYDARPPGGHYPWGQGAYLLCAATYLGL